MGSASLVLLLAAVICGRHAQTREHAPLETQPNIVLIMADDMGYSDIGAYGGGIDTPNVDRLAADGIRFSQFYNAARCSPTRASLLTGLYPHQAGLGHMPDGYATLVRKTFNSASYMDHLASDKATIAEKLRKAGYVTFMAGKWHIGYDRSAWPVARGFDRSFALIAGAMNYYGYGVQLSGKTQDPPMAEDDQVYSPPRDGFFSTDAFSDHAAAFIREHDDAKPFFLYLAYNAPHWPLQAPPADVAKYRGRYLQGWDEIRRERYRRLVDLGLISRTWELAPRPDDVPPWASVTEQEKKQWDLEMSIYAAQIERMDAGIGRVLEALRERGLEKDTLVIFLSDNGGAAEDPNRSRKGAPLGGRDSYEGYDIRGAHVSSAPFRLTKKYVHEGGIATPLMVRWPARIQQGGEIRHEPSHIVDLVPTLLDVAGVSRQDTVQDRAAGPLEGASLVSVFASQPLSPRTIYWEHEGNRAVRQGRWKLVSEHPGDWELYDMQKDRTELHDLSREVPEKARELAQLYERWAARVGAQPWELIDQARAGPIHDQGPIAHHKPPLGLCGIRQVCRAGPLVYCHTACAELAARPVEVPTDVRGVHCSSTTSPRSKLVIRRVPRIVPKLGEHRIGALVQGNQLACGYILSEILPQTLLDSFPHIVTNGLVALGCRESNTAPRFR